MFFQSDSTIYTLVFQVVRLRWKPWFHDTKCQLTLKKRPQRQRNVHDATGGHHLRGPWRSAEQAAPGAEAHFASRTQKDQKTQASRTQMGARHLRGAHRGRYRPVRIHVYHHGNPPNRKSSPSPEKNPPVYYADGTTEIGSYAEQNREIIDCAVLPDYVGNAIVASEDRSFYTKQGASICMASRERVYESDHRQPSGRFDHHPTVCGTLLFGRNHVVFRQAEGSVPGHQDRAGTR